MVEPVKTDPSIKVNDSEKVTIAVVEKNTTDTVMEKVWYKAKAIENGFEILDENDQIKYTIFKTGMDNIFTIKDKNGIVYKKGDLWVREYIENDKTIYESLFIKF